MSSRRLDQGENNCLSHTSLQDVLKRSSRRLDQGEYIHLGHISSRHLQIVLKKSSRRLAKMSSRNLQDVLKTFWRHLEDVFKTSSKRIAKISSRHVQDVFKIYHQFKLFFLTRLQKVVETYSARFWDALRLSLERFA